MAVRRPPILRCASVSSPSPRAEPPLRRHQLAGVYPAAWNLLLRARADLAGEPLLQDWATLGRPLIVRRRDPLDGDGVLLGLPLPPSAGKRRIAVEMRAAAIVSVSPLPSVSEVLGAAPIAWQPCLQELTDLSRVYEVRGGVFGSLCWQWLTGLTYLGPRSDVDIAWSLPRPDRLEQFLVDLADIDARAPVRLDGELVRADGAGANWRELHAGGTELALKTASQALLCARSDFIGAAR
jgi:phosphoribosyl-dephospho-CoA transferase